MRKAVSLILLCTILISCFTLVGCGKQDSLPSGDPYIESETPTDTPEGDDIGYDSPPDSSFTNNKPTKDGNSYVYELGPCKIHCSINVWDYIQDDVADTVGIAEALGWHERDGYDTGDIFNSSDDSGVIVFECVASSNIGKYEGCSAYSTISFDDGTDAGTGDGIVNFILQGYETSEDVAYYHFLKSDNSYLVSFAQLVTLAAIMEDSDRFFSEISIYGGGLHAYNLPF